MRGRGARKVVSGGKITSHGKKIIKKEGLFSLLIEKYLQIRQNFFVVLRSQLLATVCLLLGAAYQRSFFFSSASQPLCVTFRLPLGFGAPASLLLTVLYTFY